VRHPELSELRESGSFSQNSLITSGTTALSAKGDALEIIAEFQVGSASEFGLKVRTGNGEETLVGYNVPAGDVFVDRAKSGQVGSAICSLTANSSQVGELLHYQPRTAW
jgi:fructan beta-fructosidase